MRGSHVHNFHMGLGQGAKGGRVRFVQTSMSSVVLVPAWGLRCAATTKPTKLAPALQSSTGVGNLRTVPMSFCHLILCVCLYVLHAATSPRARMAATRPLPECTLGRHRPSVPVAAGAWQLWPSTAAMQSTARCQLLLMTSYVMAET